MAVGGRKKIFQIAKELNLATETIKEFLEKKGINVTNPNMRISEEEYELILKRFSFEKKEAEKIHKRREERVREEQEIAEQATEQTAEEQTIEEPVTAEEETPVEETAPVEEVAEETVSPEVAEESEEEAVSSEDAVEEEALETVAAEEPETAEEDTTEPEEEVEEEPQVGDIIDHPMAKQFLERQKREEELKKERQRKTLERLKKKEEEKVQRKGKKKSKEDRPQKTEKPIAAEKLDLEVASTVETETEEQRKERKKGKKKGDFDVVEDKEARRRKAFEMIRRDSKKIRPQLFSPDEITEEGIEPKEKEGRRKRQKKKKEVDQKEVDSALKKTLAEMRDTGKKRRKKIRTSEEEDIEEGNVIKVTEFISTQNLANLLDVPPAEIIRKCLELGLNVTINQRLDMDTIRLLSEEFGYGVEEEEEYASDYLETITEEEDKEEDLQPRPPVVTIMGHVDHGKTSLLDYIRHTNVVAGESGGITQHIGAYEVQLEDGRTITFLDTPGHEAFTAMRARGAQVTDIVVLVIAADDRVMPQTEEALDHAKAAGVSIVIAINKVDKPSANPEAIRKQLADRNVLVEDWGGTYQCVEVSAKSGKNIPDLLEKILLEAEVLELKANPDKQARGVVLEALLDKGKGPVATALVEEGTLEVGDCFVVGQHWGRVRAMLNERNARVESAGPSTPVQILGIDGIPEAGDRVIVMQDEKAAREIAQRRQQLKREQDFRQVRLMTLDELSQKIKTGDVKELKILVKADVDGSAQALADSLSKLSNESVEIQIIRRAVGPITESDIILAAASEAIIIGFNVRPTVKAKELADQEHVDIRLYKVIYNAIEEVEKALEGMLEPVEREVVTGTLEVREVFKISRIGTVAGCYVLNGKITRNSHVRLVRNDVEIYDGKLSSLKRFKDDTREVQSGYECGLTIENFNDIKQGDIIEAYEIVLEAQTLARSSK